MATNKLTDAQLDVLWEQYVEVYAEEQKSFDLAARTIAAAGVAVSVSIATALKTMPTSGMGAVGLFLGALTLNLVSYATSQRDMLARLKEIRDGGEGLDPNGWTKATHWLNGLAGGGVVLGGVVLLVFVSGST